MLSAGRGRPDDLHREAAARAGRRTPSIGISRRRPTSSPRYGAGSAYSSPTRSPKKNSVVVRAISAPATTTSPADNRRRRDPTVGVPPARRAARPPRTGPRRPRRLKVTVPDPPRARTSCRVSTCTRSLDCPAHHVHAGARNGSITMPATGGRQHGAALDDPAPPAVAITRSPIIAAIRLAASATSRCSQTSALHSVRPEPRSIGPCGRRCAECGARTSGPHARAERCGSVSRRRRPTGASAGAAPTWCGSARPGSR